MLTESVHRVRLAVVPTDLVHPHEIADPTREARIEARLREDGLLRDPVMVGEVPDVEGYILLDGTNRQRALATLGLPWMMVQLLDYADPHVLQLSTWCHAVDLPVRTLLEGAGSLPEVDVVWLAPLEAPDRLRERNVLALLLTRTERYALTRRSECTVSRADQLRQLVDLYEPEMHRVDCDPEEVEERAHAFLADGPHAQTLIAFPAFTRSQVVTLATQGVLIPAGITRHVVLSGRALRVNLGLEILSDRCTLEEANAALTRHLAELQPRFYQEPTVLFDS